MASLEYNCEALLMLLLAPEQATGHALSGITFRHHEATGSAALDTVVFKAEAGEHQLEGLQCREVKVSLTYGSQSATPEQADAIAAAMVESIYENGDWPDLSSFDDLEFASIEPGSDTRREDADKIRKRIVTIPMLAKIGEPVLTP